MIKSKTIQKYLLYVLAVVVVGLNVSLMFDNVVWGDEAFSANTAKNSLFGIMQILYYLDCHPPLHYIWTKLFGDMLGHTVPVYHLAALVPFIVGIILAVTVVRKRFGNIPAAFFVVISGLGASCIEYNLEIRMYSLAFLGVFGAFYCSYRVIQTGKKSAWIGMVLWALEAAYSHYYALVTVGILLFCTGVTVWIKHRGSSWQKGFAAILAFGAGYAPWMIFLFTAMKTISQTWWMTEVLSLKKTISMIFGYSKYNYIILFLVITLGVIIFVTDAKKRTDEFYTIAVGVATILGTVAFAYLLSYTMKPMLAQRYMYPLSAVTFLILVIELSRVFSIAKEYGASENKKKLPIITKTIAMAFLALLFVIGLGNYKRYRDLTIDQSIKTSATLSLIGEPEEDVVLVTNGVKHLGWSVLPCYFPKTEYINGNYMCTDKSKFWYFNPTPMSEAELSQLEELGYDVTSYGQMQISQYPFALYYVEK